MARPVRVSKAARSSAASKVGKRSAGKSPAGKVDKRDSARIAAIVDGLQSLYPDAHCELDFATPFQLLIATILSAQTTDVRVNMVTPTLFAKYGTPDKLAAADARDVEKIIMSTGFYRNKTKSILGAARVIMEDFDGKVPQTMDELLTLPGVARKTANVVLGSAFGMNEGFVVDTHIMRLSQRLGLTKQTEPPKIEQDLIATLPRDKWTKLGHQLIWHGRRVCFARKPNCGECALAPHCPSAFKV
jgi:endonuclease-3